MTERTKRDLARLAPLWKTLSLLLGLIVVTARGGHGDTILDAIASMLVKALTASGEGFDPRIFNLVYLVLGVVSMTWGVAVIGSLLALVVGALSRMLARSHVRAGQRDPLQKWRDFVAKHPRWTTVLTALPALGWSAFVARIAMHGAAKGPWEALLPQVVFPVGIAFVSIAYLVHGGIRAYLAPTLERATDEEGAELDAEGFTFDAVAVTPQTLGAIAAMVALTFGAMAVLTSREAMAFLRHTHSAGWFLGAYVSAALGGAFLFWRKSRIAIGLDGVLVGGTTKRRFVAYRDIDHARAIGETIELRSHDRAVLRLQLHGKDAGRRVAIVERLNAEIDRVRMHRADPAAAFVAGASVADLTRAAEGAASYRMAAPTRDKLWEIFESPVLAAGARRAAGEALVLGIDAEERTRFRIAADRVAEPATRVRLQELVDADAAEEEAAASSRRLQALESSVPR